MGGSQRVLLKKMTHHQTSHPRTWGPCWVNNKLTNKFEKKLILDYPLGILDYPHWVDQSEAASHTIRHVLSLPLFLFPFALDHWTRGWVMSHYHVENLPCLCKAAAIVRFSFTLRQWETSIIPKPIQVVPKQCFLILFHSFFALLCFRQDHYEDLVRYLFVMNGFGNMKGVFFKWDPPKSASR